jgi:hypothetical protein
MKHNLKINANSVNECCGIDDQSWEKIFGEVQEIYSIENSRITKDLGKLTDSSKNLEELIYRIYMYGRLQERENNY